LVYGAPISYASGPKIFLRKIGAPWTKEIGAP